MWAAAGDVSVHLLLVAGATLLYLAVSRSTASSRSLLAWRR
jgi:hypothetical protein